MKITAVHLNLFNSIELKVGRFSNNDSDQGLNKSSESQQLRAEKEKLIDLAKKDGVWVDINKIYDQQTKNQPKPADSKLTSTNTFIYDSSGSSRNELEEKGSQLNIYL